MITFILNDREVRLSAPSGTPLIEIIRRDQQLKGTKLACGEGECGACTVLVGSLDSDGVSYRSMTSCITPVANIQGRHVVTIEGLYSTTPGPVHQAMIDCNGTQCGFCTPGFVVSMTGGLLNAKRLTVIELITAMDGNICRCTGYKSIERAAEKIVDEVSKIGDSDTLDGLVNLGVVPSYFKSIRERLLKITNGTALADPSGVNIGGGTDLYVQKPYEVRKTALHTMISYKELQGISIIDDICSIGASETMSSIQDSSLIQQIIPDIRKYLAPVGSTLIRNMATVGGNLANASPIGDLTIMFLGLDASIVLLEGNNERRIKLKDFYLGYKTLAKASNTIIGRVEFVIPAMNSYHFERVCKRTFLDVASVNSACTMECDDLHVIRNVHLSAGGVAPIPLYLSHTVDFLHGQTISAELILEANEVMQSEISPISDVRGSMEYKRLLLRQLFFVHMMKLSPVPLFLKELISA
jgi:xanthine dehydrogenase small subunit